LKMNQVIIRGSVKLKGAKPACFRNAKFVRVDVREGGAWTKTACNAITIFRALCGVAQLRYGFSNIGTHLFH